MTLIFSLVTDPFVVQVSDRRLTFPDGTLFEDEENKCIFYRFQGAVAYTGLARLGFEPTADWALLPLAQDGRIAWALGSLKSEASAKFRSLRPPPAVTPSDWRKIKRTTFVCAGYQRLGNPGQFGLRQTPGGLYPFCDKVTNTEQPPGGAWSAEASDDFYDILLASGFPRCWIRLLDLVRCRSERLREEESHASREEVSVADARAGAGGSGASAANQGSSRAAEARTRGRDRGQVRDVRHPPAAGYVGTRTGEDYEQSDSARHSRDERERLRGSDLPADGR